jgi:hypothetical protein
MPCRTKKSSTCLHLLMHIFMLHGFDPLVEEAVNSVVKWISLFKTNMRYSNPFLGLRSHPKVAARLHTWLSNWDFFQYSCKN